MTHLITSPSCNVRTNWQSNFKWEGGGPTKIATFIPACKSPFMFGYIGISSMYDILETKRHENNTYRHVTEADSKSHKFISPFVLPVAINLHPSTFKTSKHLISTEDKKVYKED